MEPGRDAVEETATPTISTAGSRVPIQPAEQDSFRFIATRARKL
jgi:hypothetical protein